MRHSIQKVLEMLIDISGHSVEVKQDTALFWPSDESNLIRDNSKISALEWYPKYPLEDSLKAVCSDWLTRVSYAPGVD